MAVDQIRIENLEVYAHHGVFQEENTLGQKFLVSLVLYTDTAQAGRSDDLSFSVDYGDVAHFVEKQMKERDYKLIEAAAEHLAEEILLQYPLVDTVSVEIRKPWAPILLPLDHVSVKIRRGWTRVYLSAGSNMGDKEGNIAKAVEALREDRRIRKVTESSRIQTKPYGYTDQDDFLNSAIAMETMYQPEELLMRLHQIEAQGHRERKIRWGPRTIDLDILLYGDALIQTEELVIPHREMHLRDFVLEPMVQIAPWAVHPVFHKTIYELYQEKGGRNDDRSIRIETAD